jgi:hypothetical protein
MHAGQLQHSSVLPALLRHHDLGSSLPTATTRTYSQRSPYSGGVATGDTLLDVATAAEPATSQSRQSALTALYADSAVRTSRLGLATAVLSTWALIMDLVVYRSGAPWLQTLARVAMATMALSGAIAWRVALGEWRHRLRVLIGFGVAAFLMSAIVLVYTGVFSPFACAIALGLAVFGAVDRTGVVLPLCGALGAIHLTVGALIACGVIDDPGVFATVNHSMAERLTMTTAAVSIYCAAVWQGRVSRRSLLATIERSNQAVLEARRREALLAEANRDLDAVLAAAAGQQGRYTDRVVGSFKLGPVVGRGAMGEVYAAQHVSGGRNAAVKMLNAHAVADASIVVRFVREADIASKLHAPNVVEVLGAGEAPDGAPYLAMELLAGHDLAWHLRQRVRLPLAEVVSLVDQVALGLQAAHDGGIVHRDLKPQNLLLHEPTPPERPLWKILDFGVSKLRDSSGTLTGGAIIGTPGYMAPEQVSSGTADARADIFSLGAVAFRALTGLPAFAGSDVQAIFDVVYKQPLAPSELLRGVPADVDRVIAIALAKEPGNRFASAIDFAAALRSASGGELSPKLRARADALVRERPWGSVRQAEPEPASTRSKDARHRRT